MSWINSNATYKQNSKNDLSFYHGFSKTPVEPTSTGTAATTLANASTKGGHTVIGTEVWAEEIPWFGLVPSRAVAVTRLSGLTKLNDLVKVDGEGGKVYKYIGADDATFTEAQWSSFWQEVTLTNGMTLNNRHNQPVLRYYLNQPMQTLTTTNNASIDSKGYATRLFVNEETHVGQTSGGAVVSQFAAGTDNIKNGIPSVELNPKLYLGTTEKIAGTHYYDYNVSGTILWSTAVTSSSPKISCFRYIGKTVTGQLSTVDTTVKSHALDIADIKLALGMNPNPDSPTTSVTARVETVEDVVRVLLGLGSDATIAATESIATTAANAVSTSLAGTTEGTIGKAIADAKQEALDAIDAIQHFSVVVVPEGQTMENVTPVENTIYLVSDSQAADGSYIEYIAFKQGETVVTEKIGSTKLDLSGYTTDAEHTALADRVTALDAATTGRVAVVEGKVSTLEGQVETITSTDATKEGSIAKAIADAKTYAEQQASAAEAAAKSEASTNLSAAVEQIGKDIEAAKQAAIASAEVTITAGTGIVVEGEGKGTTFEISVSDDVATAASVSALSQTVASNKTELEGKITAAQTTLQGSIDGVSGRVTTLENTTVPALDSRLTDAEAAITAFTTGENSVDSKIAAAKGELQGEIDAINTSLTTGAIHTEIDGVRQTATAAKGKADTAVQTVKVNGTALTATSNAVDITAIVGVDETAANGIKVTKTTDNKVKVSVEPATYTSASKSWTNDTYFAKASDVATAISDAVGAIVIPTLSTNSESVGVSASEHTVDISTAAYTPAVGETAASWANKGYLVTGSTVETFVAAETAKALADAKAYSESLHTTSVDYVVADTLPTVEEGKEEEFKGKIYLVNTGLNGVVAADGARIEYMYVQENNVWGWEQIGTTTADLNGYAKSVTINGTKYEASAANAGALNLGTVVNSIGYNVTASGKTIEGPNALSVYATIATDGTLSIGVASATDTVMGLSKMFTGTLSTAASEVVDTAVSVKSAQVMYSSLTTLANSKIAGLTDYANLAGLAVVTEGGNQILRPDVVRGRLFNAAQTVENGIATSINGVQVPVESDKIVSGDTFAYNITTLKSWIDDLPNMTDGTSMFQGCTSLETFIGDLSAMTDGTSMFQGCTSLTTFIGDLSSLTAGENMFTGCKLDDESIECILDTIPASNGGYMSLGCNAEGFAKAIEITGAEVADDATTFQPIFKDWKLTFTKNA